MMNIKTHYVSDSPNRGENNCRRNERLKRAGNRIRHTVRHLDGEPLSFRKPEHLNSKNGHNDGYKHAAAAQVFHEQCQAPVTVSNRHVSQ